MRHLEMQNERARLTKRRRETQSAVDDAERQLATALKDVERAQRVAAAAQQKVDAAVTTAARATEALDQFERSLRD
jgi:hypothetical protein